MRLLVLLVIAAPVLVYAFWPKARQAVLSHMGYGLFVALLWAAALAIALRWWPKKTRDLWRIWLGAGILVAATMGCLAFYTEVREVQGVWLRDTWGGMWGQVLGGFPILYGVLKVLGLVTLACLIAAPKQTLRVIRRLCEELGAGVWLVMFGMLRGCVLCYRWVQGRVPNQVEAPVPDMESLQASVKELPDKLTLRNKMPHPRRILARNGDESGEVVVAGTTATAGGAGSKSKRAATTGVQTPASSTWVLPPIDLLNNRPAQPIPENELKSMAGRIERTLGEHGLEVRVESIRPGPRVILFGLAPGFMKKQRNGKVSSLEIARVKVDSIMAREKDLALALKTPSIRLWSPIPGEDVVGIEVPNPKPSMVSLRAVVESDDFKHIAKAGGLAVVLGEATGGEPIALDLKEMPHLLIAGATGSGKSVCINCLVCSLIMTKSPQQVRFLMVDPKRVELTPYNGIPHLIMPVIVDSDKAVAAFNGVINEMSRRYKLMEEKGVRSIDAYNRKVDEPLPNIVIVVDELADLMMTAAYEVEQSLVRLAQLGRATGIHLVLATQRPSVNVVTGLMKANIPARVAYAVASQVDSRVILDSAGAEKLLGKGDGLFQTPSDPKPFRIQGAFVSDKEIERLVLYWKSQHGPMTQFTLRADAVADEVITNTQVRLEAAATEAEEQDEGLLAKAREVAAQHKRLSPSVLQRKLRIGYAKALELIQQLEQEGAIASGDPGASREVLVKSGRGQEPS
jgi:S-DNA-T family DNA segregation ATPase FtsK/SpoIIIE